MDGISLRVEAAFRDAGWMEWDLGWLARCCIADLLHKTILWKHIACFNNIIAG
jgi:hypothetical protein